MGTSIDLDEEDNRKKERDELIDLFDSLEQNKMPMAQMKQMAFDVIQKNKSNLFWKQVKRTPTLLYCASNEQ